MNKRSTGLSTGIKVLDEHFVRLQPGDFIVLAGRPRVGKTTLALNIAETIAVKHNIPVVIFSAGEESREFLVNRMICQNANVSYPKFRTGELSTEEWEKVMESANYIENSNIVIDDTPGISINEIHSKCRKLKLEKDVQLVVVDYMQLVWYGERHTSYEEWKAKISKKLKEIAIELNIPVIVLSQLYSYVDRREDKKPILSDVQRISLKLESEADMVILMSKYYDKKMREEDKYKEYYEKEEREKNENRIILNVAKNSTGYVGEMELKFNWEIGRIEDVAK